MKTLILDTNVSKYEQYLMNNAEDEENQLLLEVTSYLYKRLKTLGARVYQLRDENIYMHPFSRAAHIKNIFDYCITSNFHYESYGSGIEIVQSVKNSAKLVEEIEQKIDKEYNLDRPIGKERKTKYASDYYYMQRLTGKTETIVINIYKNLWSTESQKTGENNLVFEEVMEAILQVICNKLGVIYFTD